MTGLQSRIEALDGVESVSLQLGEGGLEAITVRIEPGADEVAVLDGVRRLLAAYGARAPRVPAGAPPAVAESAPVGGDEPSVTVMKSSGGAATMMTAGGSAVELAVSPVGEGRAQVILARDGRSVRRQVPATPRGIVQAVLDAAAELTGSAPITLMGLNLSEVQGLRILTVITGDYGSLPKVTTVSVVDRHWLNALLEVIADIWGERSEERP